MAGDSLCQDHTNTIVSMEHVKVHRLTDGRIIGGAGNSFDVASYRKWLEGGEIGDCPIQDDRFAALILNPSRIVEWVDHKGRRAETPTPIATGSGQDFAIGAMDAGMSPVVAVTIACKRDVYSGGAVHVKAL